MRLVRFGFACGFALASIALSLLLLMVYRTCPLFPMKTHNLAWLRKWLAFSVVDFYGLAVVAAMFMVRAHGLLGAVWALGVFVLGSPVACAYAAWSLALGL